ncbi:MAG: M48 family metalloprotease, partial [Litorimonas sp.]
IFITSALMSSVGDDLNLSLVLAHEMAHIIAKHTGQTPTAQLELEADRMALVLMQNAGLDIGKAIGFWRDEIHPHIELQNTSGTHPSINERYENFRKEQARIQAIVERGQELGFE